MGFYDNEIKRDCINNPRLLIMAINSIFRKHHLLDAEVLFLDKEQNIDESDDPTFMDMLIDIEGCKYHMEFQLLEGNMAIRMYEYAVKETIKDLSKDSNQTEVPDNRYEINVVMPEQTVIFLAGANKKDEIRVNLTLPDRNTVSYTLPCISASKSLDDLCDRELYLFIPFQQVQLNDRMNHISQCGPEAKIKISQELYAYHKNVRDRLEALCENGILDLAEKDNLIESFANIEVYLVNKDVAVAKEVENMGDNDYIAWSDRVRSEGKEEGREEERDACIRIFIEDKREDGIDDEIILQKLMKRYEIDYEKAVDYMNKV